MLLRARTLAWLAIVAPAPACASSPDSRKADPAPVVPPTATVSIDFESAQPDRPPPGFTSGRTGPGALGEWAVESYPATDGNLLAQRSMDPTNMRFPLLVLDDYTARDFTLRVRFLSVSGNVDRAAGLVARFQDERNYVVVRANALEDNVRLYAVKDGERRQFGGADVEVSTGEWHELRLDARGPAFAVFLDGRFLFNSSDVAFTEAGSIGVWTKADSVTRFDDLRCGPLLPDSPLRGGTAP